MLDMELIKLIAEGGGMIALAAALFWIVRRQMGEMREDRAEARQDMDTYRAEAAKREERMGARIDMIEEWARTELVTLANRAIAADNAVSRSMSHFTDTMMRLPCLHSAEPCGEEGERNHGKDGTHGKGTVG